MFAVQEEMREREERSEGRKQADATRREQEVASAGGSGGQAAGSWRSRDRTTHLATSRGIVPLLLSTSPLPLSVAWKPGTSSICHSSPLTHAFNRTPRNTDDDHLTSLLRACDCDCCLHIGPSPTLNQAPAVRKINWTSLPRNPR